MPTRTHTFLDLKSLDSGIVARKGKSLQKLEKRKKAKVPVEDHAFRAMLNITGVSEMPCLTKAATYPEDSEKMPLFFVLLLMTYDSLLEVSACFLLPPSNDQVFPVGGRALSCILAATK